MKQNDPYGGLLGVMREQGAEVNSPAPLLGRVSVLAPLKVRLNGAEITVSCAPEGVDFAVGDMVIACRVGNGFCILAKVVQV